jgi:hypothetical protein
VAIGGQGGGGVIGIYGMEESEEKMRRGPRTETKCSNAEVYIRHIHFRCPRPTPLGFGEAAEEKEDEG